MDARHLEQILRAVSQGTVTAEQAFDSLKSMTYDDIDIAKVDSFRSMRQGFPEVIFGPGKTAPQIITIAETLLARQPVVIATKVDAQTAEQVLLHLPSGRYEANAQMLIFGDESGCGLEHSGVRAKSDTSELKPQSADCPTKSPIESKPLTEDTVAPFNQDKEAQPSSEQTDVVSIVTAGTADLAVGEEAALYLVASGIKVHQVCDVGVAGIHRLFPHVDELNHSQAVIVVAGMDGALASVLGGLLSVPIIAVPTSVGYGASFQGVSALLAMLCSCAAGLTVVNIDNGFGAAMAALRITNANHKRLKASSRRSTDIG